MRTTWAIAHTPPRCNARRCEERTAELERERERTAAQAVALDRVRIARELHDVVAHHVSAMGVQAGAARAVLERDPAAARAALLGHRVVRALGAERAAPAARDAPHASRRRPQRVDGQPLGLPELVEHARENGLPTTLTVVGEPIELPALVQVNTYRIAQEALTNARRHGGPDAAADVRLRYGANDSSSKSTNTGRGALARPARPRDRRACGSAPRRRAARSRSVRARAAGSSCACAFRSRGAEVLA